MNTLSIHNPATGEQIASLEADTAASVAAKAAAARAAQPAWAAMPLAERRACIATPWYASCSRWPPP
ncbi:aldehyde dehydrogenase family protein [Ramlibacter sp.]|uniref:aldehyde dehydrogenase family protein n=1 Tax=Ramlibacter sp. TaxID=1917967 RepID=UPI0025E7321A|nr:aldehyde dehydrogenase family protein [Ramlibacter sp.]